MNRLRVQRLLDWYVHVYVCHLVAYSISTYHNIIIV